VTTIDTFDEVVNECPTCAAAGINHEEHKKLILSSPIQTGIWICGFDWFINSELHHNVNRWFMKGLASGERRFVAMLPRDNLKTTYFGVSYIVWLILNDPEVRILYRMSSATEAQKTLRSVSEILKTSENLAHFFPDSVLDVTDKKVRDTQDYLRVRREGIYREGTVEARGVDSKVTGGHFTHHIYDDLIDENMIDSDQLQHVAINRIKRSDSLFVNPSEDIELIIGTRWPGAFYQWLLEDSGITDEYYSMVLGCYKDARYREWMRGLGQTPTGSDDDPVWPQHFTKEALKKIERKSPYDFVHQWKNLAIDEGGRRFRKEDFNLYYKDRDRASGVEKAYVNMANGGTYEVALGNLYRTTTIDPATGEHARTDYSAITTCGFDRKTGMIFLLDAKRGKWLPNELIENIILAIQRWKPHVVSPEDVAFQKTLKHFLKQEMSRRGVNAPIRPVKPGRTGKGRRILDALQPFVAAGQLYVLKDHLTTVVDELVSMQVVGGKVVGKSPDLADSLAYHAEFWRGLELNREPLADNREHIPEWQSQRPTPYGLEVST
jgi:predicted phage terminase large subunit-like protein